MKLNKILVVEDEVMVREFRAGWFRIQGYKEVYEAGRLSEADRLSEAHPPDLVLLDMELPDGQGTEYVERQMRRQKLTRILVLTGHMGSYPVVRLKRSGVMGVLDKGATTGEELRRAVEALRLWRTYYSERVERTFRELVAESSAFYKTLSEREEEMVKMFGLGMSNEMVAEEEGLSVSTVQGHRRNVMLKLGVKSSPELIIWAIRNGFVSEPQIKRGPGTRAHGARLEQV
jgi:DNA-binding NarL/FixJ family response regulator